MAAWGWPLFRSPLLVPGNWSRPRVLGSEGPGVPEGGGERSSLPAPRPQRQPLRQATGPSVLLSWQEEGSGAAPQAATAKTKASLSKTSQRPTHACTQAL